MRKRHPRQAVQLHETLSVDRVLEIHNVLVRYFEASNEPIRPSGVKSIDLLESAVSRQTVGSGEKMKYDNPYKNAATLMYGICMNHPFHNGNKRTALVACLIHLDTNKLIPFEVSHNQFYNLLLNLANHSLEIIAREEKFPGVNADLKFDVDQEIHFLSLWLEKYTRRIDKKEYPMRFRELRRLLEAHGCRLGDPQKSYIDVHREEVEEIKIVWGALPTFFPTKKRTVWKRCSQIHYAGENVIVNIETIKKVRKDCSLTHEDGVDSHSFYDLEAKADGLLNDYRTLLLRLAKT